MTDKKRHGAKDEISLRRLMYYWVKGLKKFCTIGCLLMTALALCNYLYTKLTYVPRYEVKASLIVTNSMAESQTVSELTMAAQMGKTFSYIVRSDLLRNVVANDLGVDQVLANITASAVSGTNLLTITVRDDDPQRTLDTLDSVLENYPAIADYILGPTKIEMIYKGELPVSPYNKSEARDHFLLGLLAGAILYGGMALIYALLVKTAGSADDIRQSAGAEFLTAIPRTMQRKWASSKKLMVEYKATEQSVVEGFLVLANSVEQHTADCGKRKNVYMVTSTTAGEGKSTVASNLAFVLSRRKKSVLLIDADLRSTTISRWLYGSSSPNMLQQVLQGECSIMQAATRYQKTSLYVLSSAHISNSAQVLHTLSDAQFEELMYQASEQFDYVIVDTPPYGLLADAAAIAPYCDSVIFVVRQDYAQIADIEEAIARIRQNQTKLLGFVMNDVQRGSGNYGYGYGYGYRYDYGYGYDYRYKSQNYRNYYDRQDLFSSLEET